jgi:RNA polymerase-interacting CarD/CdnL/TRCF family regulator
MPYDITLEVEKIMANLQHKVHVLGELRRQKKYEEAIHLSTQLCTDLAVVTAGLVNEKNDRPPHGYDAKLFDDWGKL